MAETENGLYSCSEEEFEKILYREKKLAEENGIIDWEDFAESIKDIGFDGVFSLETLPPNSLSAELFEKYCIILHDTVMEICGA